MYMNPPIIKLSEHLCSVVQLWLVTQLRESHTCKLYTANAKKTRKVFRSRARFTKMKMCVYNYMFIDVYKLGV